MQGNRFSALLLGHGREGSLWVIDWVELPAEPTEEASWRRLDEWLGQPLVNAAGIAMKPLMAAVDSGYLTDQVLTFTRERQRRGVIAVKGSSIAGKPIIGKPSKLDVTVRGHTLKGGAEGWLVGADTAKHTIFARLAADGKRLPQERAVRFAEGLDASFYSQLTAEIWEPNRRRWVKIRPRNEALDTFVYALAAAHHPSLRIHLWKEPQWAKLEAALEPAHGDLFAASAPTCAAPGAVPTIRERRRDVPMMPGRSSSGGHGFY